MPGEPIQEGGVSVLRPTKRRRRAEVDLDPQIRGEIDLHAAVAVALRHLPSVPSAAAQASTQTRRLEQVLIEHGPKIDSERVLNGEPPEDVAEVAVGTLWRT